jgi:hypothetical protein
MNEALSRALFEDQTKGISDRLLKHRNWRLWEKTYPVLEVSFVGEKRAELRLRFRCDGWNALPPSIELLSPAGDRLTSIQELRLPVQFNNTKHPNTGYPFVCMAGAREYHTYPSHVTDVWENYKNKSGYALCEILDQLWSAWQKGTG